MIHTDLATSTLDTLIMLLSPMELWGNKLLRTNLSIIRPYFGDLMNDYISFNNFAARLMLNARVQATVFLHGSCILYTVR